MSLILINIYIINNKIFCILISSECEHCIYQKQNSLNYTNQSFGDTSITKIPSVNCIYEVIKDKSTSDDE